MVYEFIEVTTNCHNNNNLLIFSYELQIEKDYQRKGLGRFMLNALEKMTKYYEMEKLILTVLSNNQNARDFFTSMGFKTDDSSPDREENTGYEILSKLFT